VIYLDSSVVLAHLLMESRRPPRSLWQESLASSRLLQYEVWNRIYAYADRPSHTIEVRGTLARIYLIEMSDEVLARAMLPFPIVVRTLDALHLSTAMSLMSGGEAVELASYDNRLLGAARALGIAIAAL
jgi:predicted nucleic acid-binding protein